MSEVFNLILILTISVLLTSCNSRSGKRINNQQLFQVIKVVDGDTFWADSRTSKRLKVRLIGVDAPESRKTFRKEVGHFGKEAKEYLDKMIGGKNVKIEFDIDTFDQYGRTLAYVYLENGTFINLELVKNGYAMVMTIPPNVRYAEEFVQLQREARENNRGLWKSE